MSDNLNITSNDNVTIVDDVEYVQCAHCGQLVPADSLHDVYVFGDNDYYDVEEWCDECVDSDATRCERCGELVDRTVEVHVGSIGRIDDWCPDCVNEHAAECEHCGTLYERDELATVITSQNWCCPNDTEEWCPDCVDGYAAECNDCGELFARSCNEFHEERTWDGDYIWICDNCRDDNWRWCDGCDRLVHIDDYYYDDNNDCVYCPDCWEEHHCDALMGYHHTGGSCFWQDDATQVKDWMLRDKGAAKRLYLGVELETDYNDSAVDLARDVMAEFTTDQIECKHDGSLHSEGVEFVSQPGTPLWQLTSGMWERVVEIVRSHDGQSHDAGSCGLHIHGSRAFFKDHDAVYRLDRLFHRFRSEMIRFSRRTPNQLGQWCRLGDEHDELSKIESVTQRKREWENIKGWSGRYECVNDTNPATVEIRLWRGTLNVQTLRATIEFTTGLFLVANTMTDEYADELTWPVLKSLVHYALLAEGIPCDDLDAYLELRNL